LVAKPVSSWFCKVAVAIVFIFKISYLTYYYWFYYFDFPVQ
jgi:hypothetical protein